MRATHLLVALVLLSQTVMAQTRNTATIYDGKKVYDILAFVPSSACAINDSWEDGNSRGEDRSCVAGNLACNLHGVQYADDGTGKNSEWVYTGSCSFPVNPIDADVKAILDKAGIKGDSYR